MDRPGSVHRFAGTRALPRHALPSGATSIHPQDLGLDSPVRVAAIATGGHHTRLTDEFCRTRLIRRIRAIKGRGGPGIPVWPRRPPRTNKGKIPLFVVGVDALKDAITPACA